MKKDFSSKGKRPAEQQEDDDLQAAREAAKKQFTEEDRKAFWKKYEDDKNKPKAPYRAKPSSARERSESGFSKSKDPYRAQNERGGKREPARTHSPSNDGFETRKRAGTPGDARPARSSEGRGDNRFAGRERNGTAKHRQEVEGKPKWDTSKDRFKRHFDSEGDDALAYESKGGRKPKQTPEERPESGEMPLNKYVAHCGISSRRDAVELIKGGKISVNDEVITTPAYKVKEFDVVRMNGKVLKVQKNLVYILLNKPKGFITTTEDPKGRKTVMDIFGEKVTERVFPIGRLDRNTTGLLLFTNDGDLAQQLAHPKYQIRKIYQVTLDKKVSIEDFNHIMKGVQLEDGVAEVDQMAYLDHKNEIGLEIHSGKNRIVRRIFESLGYEVEKLDRVMYAGLTKKNLRRGAWRHLTHQEVVNIKFLKGNKQAK